MNLAARLALLAALAVASAEAYARFGLGLGDPPLILVDSKLEYVFAPGRSYSRFGNHVSYNSQSMRSAEVPSATKPADLRVLVLGDSVVNGGALIDQKDLATEILARTLGPHAWVGNISAGWWGPGNLLAYVRQRGWFDADWAIIVVSTHDRTDLPEFRAHYGIDFPEAAPTLALQELIVRYLPRYVPGLGHLVPERSPPTVTYSPEERNEKGDAALRDLLAAAKEHVGNVVVVMHPTKTEIETAAQPQPDRARLKDLIQASRVELLDLEGAPVWSASLYRDDIHTNAAGQAAYARVFACLLQTRKAGRSAESCRYP